MPEDVKDVQDQATADPVAPVGDIDFDRAAEDAERRLEGPAETPVEEKPVEEVKEPEPEVKEEPVVATPEEPKVDPEEHKERTRLGRKVSELSDTVGKLLEQNNLLLQRLAAPKQDHVEPEQEYVDLSTPEGLDRFLSQREQARMSAVQRDKIEYGLGYQTEVNGWIEQATESKDPDATEIHKLLIGETPFNVRKSANPKADFEANLSRAEAHYYKQKAKNPPAEKKSPLQNSTPRAPLAVGGESKVDTSTSVKPVKMSEQAMEFAKSMGWGDDEVSKILSTPVANSFVKRR